MNTLSIYNGNNTTVLNRSIIDEITQVVIRSYCEKSWVLILKNEKIMDHRFSISNFER